HGEDRRRGHGGGCAGRGGWDGGGPLGGPADGHRPRPRPGAARPPLPASPPPPGGRAAPPADRGGPPPRGTPRRGAGRCHIVGIRAGSVTGVQTCALPIFTVSPST